MQLVFVFAIVLVTASARYDDLEITGTERTLIPLSQSFSCSPNSMISIDVSIRTVFDDGGGTGCIIALLSEYDYNKMIFQDEDIRFLYPVPFVRELDW